jgi:hypothetical protein
MQRLPVFDPRGNTAGNQLTITTIKVHGRPPAIPTAMVRQTAHFSDQIDLIGFTQSPADSTGTPATLTLVWRARGRPSASYTVFVHLLDEHNRIVGQADSPPRSGPYPTSLWDAGETITDDHPFTLPTTLAAGTYHYSIGWYAPDTGRRLAATEDAEHTLGDAIILVGPTITDNEG